MVGGGVYSGGERWYIAIVPTALVK